MEEEYLVQVEGDECSICLELITTPVGSGELLSTPCEHVFHKKCLWDWFASGVPGDCCPVCKKKMRRTEPIPVERSRFLRADGSCNRPRVRAAPYSCKGMRSVLESKKSEGLGQVSSHSGLNVPVPKSSRASYASDSVGAAQSCSRPYTRVPGNSSRPASSFCTTRAPTPGTSTDTAQTPSNFDHRGPGTSRHNAQRPSNFDHRGPGAFSHNAQRPSNFDHRGPSTFSRNAQTTFTFDHRGHGTFNHDAQRPNFDHGGALNYKNAQRPSNDQSPSPPNRPTPDFFNFPGNFFGQAPGNHIPSSFPFPDAASRTFLHQTANLHAVIDNAVENIINDVFNAI